MRAIVQEQYGPHRDVLHVREVPAPIPGTGQVLVRVRATSVHADVWHAVNGIPYVLRLMGSGLRAPKQQIPGTDLAGEVIRAGDGAGGFAPGDRVFGEVTASNQWSNGGTLAEFAAVDENRLARIPEDLSYLQAAAVPTAALIALMNLSGQGRVRSGQRVLVNGAAGAVGVWAVQLAKALGPRQHRADAAAAGAVPGPQAGPRHPAWSFPRGELGDDRRVAGRRTHPPGGRRADLPPRPDRRRDRLPEHGRRAGSRGPHGMTPTRPTDRPLLLLKRSTLRRVPIAPADVSMAKRARSGYPQRPSECSHPARPESSLGEPCLRPRALTGGVRQSASLA